MNIAMYAPITFLAVMLFRRPALLTVSLLLVSASTELAQAIIPHMGRSCASEDFAANSLGAVLGTLAAVLVSKKRHPENAKTMALRNRDHSLAVKVSLVGAFSVLVIGNLSVTTLLTEVYEMSQVNSSQEKKAKEMVRKVYGNESRISSIQYVKGETALPGQTLITLEDGFLSFTDEEDFITGSTMANTLPGIKKQPVKSDEDATRQAKSFVSSRFPWALMGSEPMVDPTVPGTGQKTVAWRQRVEGVLMPMRMDVVVEPDGRISSFTGRNEAGPKSPPEHKMTAAQAKKIAAESVPAGTYESSELLAQKNKEGSWETRWVVNLAMPSEEESSPENVSAGEQGASIVIHANTGRVIEVDYGVIE